VSPASGLSAEAWVDAERDRAKRAAENTVAVSCDDLRAETATTEGAPKTATLDHVENEAAERSPTSAR
jgi:hypothetical protein